jgi:peptidoglycan/LPS O-acetylase OafA/YrhL
MQVKESIEKTNSFGKPPAKTGHIPELDGIRAISILFVVLLHASYGRLSGGFLGVDIFFVLSGYLITTLLRREYAATGRIDLKNFYMRRFLRIVPALVVCVLIAALLWPIAEGQSGPPLNILLAVLFFYANFLDANQLKLLGHTWSLAVEEQFYLWWPLAFLISFSKSFYATIALAALVVILGLCFRIGIETSAEASSHLLMFSPARMDSIMVGCLLALIEPALFNIRVLRKSIPTRIFAWTSLALMCAALIFATASFVQATPPAFTLFACVAGTFIMFSQRLPKNDLAKRFLLLGIVQYVGRRSYGLYLMHYPIFGALEVFRVPGNFWNFVFVTIAKVGLSMVATELSWLVIERPMLALKKYFVSRTAHEP